MKNFGERLRNLRERKNLSVAELAKIVGVPVSTYREWEYGRAIRGEPYVALSLALEVSLDELFLTERSKQPVLVKQNALSDAREIEKRSRSLIRHLSSF